MGTKISWADESWNPIVGCSKISGGCQNCFAERMAYRQACMGTEGYNTIVCQGQARWTGRTVFQEHALTKPLHWRKPRKIFVCSMGDLFHESVPFDWIHKIIAIITMCHHHQFLFLTKRADIMFEYFNQPDLWNHHIPEAIKLDTWFHRGVQEPLPGHIDFSAVTHRIIPPLPNLHLGVTVENQDNVGRILDLVKTPRAGGFISFEPVLGRIDCQRIDAPGREAKNILEDISYAFIGCESGPKARLCSQEDIRHVMKQCRDAGVKIHVKQIPLNGKCNKDITQWPPEFQVREV